MAEEISVASISVISSFLFSQIPVKDHFPSISTGVYHFPLEQASVIAIRTISDYLKDHPEIEKVRMVCFDEGTKKYYEEALAAIEG